MEAIILAGGFGLRLGSISRLVPKPLLEVGGKPVISYILEQLESLVAITRITISTNINLKPHFEQFLLNGKFQKPIELICEPCPEGEKLGAVSGLNYALSSIKAKAPIMVIGGDNLFSFDFNELLKKFNEHNMHTVALYSAPSLQDISGKYGIAVMVSDQLLVEFQEKPLNPSTNLVSTACYIFKDNVTSLISKYLDEGCHKDSLGGFIKWLVRHEKVYGFKFESPWYDIGNIKDLEIARSIWR